MNKYFRSLWTVRLRSLYLNRDVNAPTRCLTEQDPSAICRPWFLAIQNEASRMKFRMLLLLLLVLPGCAGTRTCIADKSGCGVVVHRNFAPVVVHRIFPPYGVGKHVYSGRSQ